MIPKPVYEILPVIYVVGGILAMLSVQSLTSFVSGLVMGVSGIMVLTMRRKYRANLEKKILARKNRNQIPAVLSR